MLAIAKPQPTAEAITAPTPDVDPLVVRFRSHIAECVADPKCREIVVDFEQFPLISSRLINELIRTHLQLRLSDRSMRLVNVLPHIAEVLKLLRIDRTIEFSEVPICIESGQPSKLIKQRVDRPENLPTDFLRVASRTLSLLRLS